MAIEFQLSKSELSPSSLSWRCKNKSYKLQKRKWSICCHSQTLGKLAGLSKEPVPFVAFHPCRTAGSGANQQKNDAALLLPQVRAVLWGKEQRSAEEELVYLNISECRLTSIMASTGFHSCKVSKNSQCAFFALISINWKLTVWETNSSWSWATPLAEVMFCQRCFASTIFCFCLICYLAQYKGLYSF